MRLKKIKLAGFKSFVDPTSIPFPGDMTAIVGPNGCGKSNVIDAVRWVLGESSAKNLRGDAMTDVIFNGSSARKPVGQCSVELVFDNSAGRIGGEYAKYNELSVKRIVTRDAQSLYQLNGTRCRRRDVTDLFLGTGLGPRSYAIIEQGMISRLIESKPQELRVFIEEAAGISKYKERRRETENRIRHTLDNLDRLEDVRGELGQQLEKLQRQAAAANRYKTLKATERTLKSELAAIRWLKHNEHISELESQLAQQQTELDALVAQQRGDEAGMVTYQAQQDELKSQLDDLQQTLFSKGNAITRIEQNALHAKQRRSQIEQELAALEDRRDGLQVSMQQGRDALEHAQEALAQLAPRSEMLEAMLIQAQDEREELEQALRTFNAESREHEKRYNELKHQVQSCHSQIQSTMSMQLRTSQRVSELKNERDELSQDLLQEQMESLLENKALAEEKVAVAEHAFGSQRQQVQASEQRVQLASQQLRDKENQYQQSLSRIAALETLQEAASDTNELMDGLIPLWQSLSVKPGYEALIEQVLSQGAQPLVAEQLGINALLDSCDALPGGQRVYSQSLWVEKHVPGSLSDGLAQSRIPAFFNHIYVCESVEDALQRQTGLADHETIIVKDGPILGKDWIMQGQADAQAGVLQRQAQLAALQLQADEERAQTEQAQAELDDLRDDLNLQQQQADESKQALQQAQHHLQQLQSQHSVLDMQITQNRARADKVEEELVRQEQLLETEAQQLEELSARLEMLEEEILEHEVHVNDVQAQREALEIRVQQSRLKVDQQTSERHQLALSLQQQKGQAELYEQQVQRNTQQLEEYRSRTQELHAERDELSQPLALQQEQLQELLAQREEIEAQRMAVQGQLEQVEQLLKEAQQDKQGVVHKIQQRQSAMDSVKIEIEGYRVRATSVLEQLQETGQSLKPILENLNPEAEEKAWQSELEKTTAAVSRLGAVNLAAVEEYEVQSERKAHLDAQHEDLANALETLQSAIRKIDKETKARFSSTFEQVNEDLKQLFPKVFGGGSAYLALTDDDLLETGVTIMARPPGKKNSTIHLLSGGEKALTALSLVFAIFRLNPAPFCLLDEVDAPLDDANVGRFCKLVSEMSKTVQFIYITHNKIAMEMASHLTGVTMAEPGVSRMVAVDVDEAMAFAEA